MIKHFQFNQNIIIQRSNFPLSQQFLKRNKVQFDITKNIQCLVYFEISILGCLLRKSLLQHQCTNTPCPCKHFKHIKLLEIFELHTVCCCVLSAHLVSFRFILLLFCSEILRSCQKTEIISKGLSIHFETKRAEWSGVNDGYLPGLL